MPGMRNFHILINQPASKQSERKKNTKIIKNNNTEIDDEYGAGDVQFLERTSAPITLCD